MSLKCAVAFFGVPRNSIICFPSIQKNIYSVIPESFEVRSFYHLNKQEIIDNPRSNEKGLLLESNYEPFYEMEGVCESPESALEKWNYDYFYSIGDTWGDKGRSIKNLIYQLSSLREVTLMIERSKFAPDVIIFLRPDLIYHNKIPPFIFKSLSCSPKSIYIPGWQWFKGLNDRFAICGSESYKVYGKRIELAIKYCESNNLELHAEKLLKYSVAHCKVKFLKCFASRVRLSGEIVNENFNCKNDMGRRENRVLLLKSRVSAFLDKIKYS